MPIVVICPTCSTRLSAQDWARAAVKAIANGGLAAVAVEPLARTLGVTKGSFYAHFRNRDELVTAALAEWRERSTLLGRAVEVRLVGRAFAGTATAIDDEGALIVHTGDGVERVVSGEVRLA